MVFPGVTWCDQFWPGIAGINQVFPCVVWCGLVWLFLPTVFKCGQLYTRLTSCTQVWQVVHRCNQFYTGVASCTQVGPAVYRSSVVANVSLSGFLSQTRPGKQANNEKSVRHFSAVCKQNIVCHVAPTTKNSLRPSHTTDCIPKLVSSSSRAHTFEQSVRTGQTCLGYTRISSIWQNF